MGRLKLSPVNRIRNRRTCRGRTESTTGSPNTPRGSAIIQSAGGLNVLVTGAAMGPGKLFATQAVKEGAAVVVLSDANEAALKETIT